MREINKKLYVNAVTNKCLCIHMYLWTIYKLISYIPNIYE